MFSAPLKWNADHSNEFLLHGLPSQQFKKFCVVMELESSLRHNLAVLALRIMEICSDIMLMGSCD